MARPLDDLRIYLREIFEKREKDQILPDKFFLKHSEYSLKEKDEKKYELVKGNNKVSVLFTTTKNDEKKSKSISLRKFKKL